MSALVTVEVDGNDLTDFLQDKSMSIKRQSLDATFIDPSSVPLLGDAVVTTNPTWAGTCVLVELVGYRGNVPFYKIRATNTDPLTDLGAAPFALADTGTRYSSPAGFKDLVVTSVLDDTTEEVRSKCIVFKEGLLWGMEVDITSVVAGYTAETFTIMEMTVEWPVDDAANYTLDLGLGVFADAVTGGPPGDEGTVDDPWLDPPTLKDEIERIAKDECCDDDGDVGSPLPGDQIPLEAITAGGVCDTADDYALVRYYDGGGTFGNTLSGTSDVVGSWVYNNSPYTDANYPCALGGGSWSGYQDEEIWYEFVAPADDPTKYLGIVTELDCSVVSIMGSVQGYSIRLAQGAAASTRYGHGTTIMSGPITGTVQVYIPRNLVDWGGTNCLVLHADWLCDRPARFCNPPGDFNNPHADGRANSGSYADFSVDDFCPVGLEVGFGAGVATAVAGIGDVDGSNAEFELIGWTTTGPVEVTVNGLPVLDSEITYDTGAGTVTLDTPPATGSVVLFSYRASS